MDEKSVHSLDEHHKYSNDNNVARVEKIPAEISRNRIVKNLVIVSFGFLLNFTAYGGLANLQSTLNKEDGLGLPGWRQPMGRL